MKPIPSLTELYTALESDLKNKLGLSDSEPRTVVDAFASTIAGQLKLAYLYLNDIQNNLFPDTADTSENGGELNRIGQIKLNRQPYPATDGKYIVQVVGLAGAVIRAGLTFKSNDDAKSPGNLYVADQEYILIGTDDEIEIRSLAGGPDYILEIGNALTATEPLIGIDQQILVTSVSQLPTAAETTELYRKKNIDSYRLEPQGGSKTDYRLWASDAQGVERVYPYVKNGEAGVVQVFVEATKIDSIDGFGTPNNDLLDAVAEVIEMDPDATLPLNERGRRPIQAILEVLPIEVKPVDIEITGLQIDNSSIRESILNNLETFLFDVRPFIAGADLSSDKNDILAAVKVQSVVTDTIGNGNTFTEFTLFVDGGEVNSYTFSGALIPYLRNITYL